jgi:CRP-like cAMP-binding protein
MPDQKKQPHIYAALKESIEAYAVLTDETWDKFLTLCSDRRIEKGQVLYQAGDTPTSFGYVYSGLLRGFTIDNDGKEYSKNFFDQGSFPGSMRSLLKSEPSQFTIDALEPSVIVEVNFAGYRALLREKHDLALFQIEYLERNWLLAKDIREIEIVMEDATQRYMKFLHDYPGLQDRVQQYHIASHLGITPTQLSRIRKKILLNQHM